MRLPMIAAAVLAATAPLPVLAQDAEHATSDLTEKLSDPAMQERAAVMLGAMIEVMMDMPVGPLAEAMADATDGDMPAIDPDATLRDVMGPEAEDMPREMAERLPRLIAMMGVMAGALEEMAPRMREAVEDLPTAE